jgi:hypothetical protein
MHNSDSGKVDIFMFRKFAVEIERSVNTGSLAWPESDMCEDDCALGENRDYRDLRGASWDDATRVFALEESLLERLASADDLAATLDIISDELYEDPEGLWGLDIGVASTVIALSAARCIPCASCNGGCFGDGHHEGHPLVLFYAMPAWMPYLLEAAEEAKVGLINEDYGSILVYADDISRMILFASALITHRQNFDELDISLSEASESGNLELGSKPSLDEYTLPLPFDRFDNSN